jgi:hypothetical protein
MALPTARQLEQLAEELRVVAGQMRTPFARQELANLALSYARLAHHAALREASGTGEQNDLLEPDRIQTDEANHAKDIFRRKWSV